MLLSTCFCGAIFLARGGIGDLASRWLEEEPYSHGFLMLLVAAYFLWRNWGNAGTAILTPSRLGMMGVSVALFVVVVSEIAEVRTLSQYGLLAFLYCAIHAYFGWAMARRALAPLAMLLFVIPLPYYFQIALTANLQLWSTTLGVWCINLLGIPVFQTGNLIDLGTYQLQVIEACAGLNYLYPLLGLSFIVGYTSRDPIWMRVLVVLSAIPITIGLNSFRIAMVGVLVQKYGPSMADGFLHEFQGFVVFGMSVALILGWQYFLRYFIARRQSNQREPRVNMIVDPVFNLKKEYGIWIGCLGLTLSAIVLSETYRQEQEIIPSRLDFLFLPKAIEGWTGETAQIDLDALAVLDPSDYAMRRYKHSDYVESVEFYSAYYESQRSGASIHSPKVCLPGGGWEITEMTRIPYSSELGGGRINRVLLRNGGQELLLYYWFQQRGRILASENTLKWFLLWDGFFKNRTDGALIRIATRIDHASSETIEAAEQRLIDLSNSLSPLLPRHIPGFELI